MTEISFEEKVRSIDWAKYLEPEYRDPTKLHFKPERAINSFKSLRKF